MPKEDTEIIHILRKIHDLLELLAEEKVAQRDAKKRATLREVAGVSIPMRKSILLMDGTRSQKDIRELTSANQGNLSTLVGKLQKAGLLVPDVKLPKLSISIPATFFDDQ